MFQSAVIISYIAASAAIIISPGPAQALVLSITISSGKKAGFLTVLGLNSSMIVHILAAAFGMSALLSASAEAFTAVKFAGAAYLIYLGILSLRKSKDSSTNTADGPVKKIYFKAFLTGALNPKVALFFLAFVPQFVNPAKGYVTIQFLILGIILAVMDILYEGCLVILTGRFTSILKRNSFINAVREKISGIVMIALGIKMAFLRNR